MKIRVVPYEITIKDIKSKKSLNLITEINIQEEFKKFLSAHKDIEVLDTQEKIFSIKEWKETEKNIYGIIGSGNFGFERDLVETKQKKRISKITASQADEIPFYFLLKVFEEKVILLISFFKVYSAKTLFQEEFKKFLESRINFKDKNLIFMPILDKTLFKKQLKEIKKLHLIKTMTPNDVEKNLDLELIEDWNTKNKKVVKDERIFSLSSWSLKGIAQTIVNQIKNKRESGYYKIGNENYVEAEVEIELQNGIRRKVNIEELEIKQSTTLEFYGNFPSLEEFYKEATPYFNEIKKQAGKTK